jgi:hypothetical protein
MIKLVHIAPAGPRHLALSFSDGSSAIWSAEPLISRQTELTTPLEDEAYFARAFIEAGALAWPNGLELSPAALHQRLEEEGKLTRTAA